MLKSVYTKWVSFKQKALVAGAVGAVGTYLSTSGLTLHDVLTKQGFHALLVGIVSHVFVYLTENK